VLEAKTIIRQEKKSMSAGKQQSKDTFVVVLQKKNMEKQVKGNKEKKRE
jgi:hypothetical protein